MKWTKKEIQDMAMREATGNNMIQSFTYDEFAHKDFKCLDYVWEPFQGWSEGDYASQIMQCYEGIMRILERLEKQD